MGKEQVQTRLDTDTMEQLDEYRDEKDVTQAEAVRRLIRRGLEAEAEPEPVTDGGHRISRHEHPWVDPLVAFAYDTSKFGVYSLFVSLVAFLIPGGAVGWFGASLSQETAALFLSLFALGALAGTALVVLSLFALFILEFLMHPAEAPISRYVQRFQKWRGYEGAAG